MERRWQAGDVGRGAAQCAAQTCCRLGGCHTPQAHSCIHKKLMADADHITCVVNHVKHEAQQSSSSGARSGVARRSSSGGAQLQPGAGGALQLPVKFNYRVIWIDLPVAGLDQAAWIVERGEGS